MTLKPFDEGGGGKTESAAGPAGRYPGLGENSSGRQRKGLPGIRGDGFRLHTLPAPSERWQSLDFVAVPGFQEDKDFGQENPIQDDLGT